MSQDKPVSPAPTAVQRLVATGLMPKVIAEGWAEKHPALVPYVEQARHAHQVAALVHLIADIQVDAAAPPQAAAAAEAPASEEAAAEPVTRRRK